MRAIQRCMSASVIAPRIASSGRWLNRRPRRAERYRVCAGERDLGSVWCRACGAPFDPAALDEVLFHARIIGCLHRGREFAASKCGRNNRRCASSRLSGPGIRYAFRMGIVRMPSGVRDVHRGWRAAT